MIPNICHFVFGFKEQNDEFLFCYYLAVYSAYIVNKPHKINFFYHHEPHGPWWEKLKKIPCVSLIHIPIPTHIGKKIIKKTAHKADWIRMNVLYQFGGVYLDIDTICVKPWKDLLNERVVLATQIPIPGICNAIMMTEPKSEFFKIWLDRYEKPFNPDGWEESSIFLPLEIMITNFDKVTMKNPDTFFIPHFKETEKIFELPQDIPDNLVSLHLWESYTLKHMKNINDWNWCIDNKHTLYGKMMLNLLENFMLNDNNYLALKECFQKNDDNLICKGSTILKKSLKHSSELEDNMKIKFEKYQQAKFLDDLNENYYLVSNNLWNWNSQKDQDYWVIHEIFDYKKNGFFVDLAATDGKEINNTYIMEKKLNWEGICIEANPDFHKDLYKNRNCHISEEIVGDENGKLVKFRVDVGGLNGIIDKKYDNTFYDCKFIEKETVTLESILDKYNAPKVIDYLSLDIEGAEYDVLKNFPFDKYTFLSITIEGPSQLLDILLFENDYLFVRKSKKLNGYDSYYIHKSILNDKIKLEPYSLSLRRSYINQKKNLPPLHIIHRIDKTNTGDMVSNCSEYYSFEDYRIIKHDIYNPDFSKINKNDNIILSGGGLLNCLEIWNQNINKLLEISENVIGWGIGLNKHHRTNIKTEINFDKFKLLGIRDYNVKLSEHTEYVPCSSCKLPYFNKEYKIKRKIGICEHHEKKINLAFDKINNEAEISEIIKFIGETDLVLSNTYHCLYFSLLLKKKSLLFNSFSEKFNNFKYKFKLFEECQEIEEEKLIIDNGDTLKESIKINDEFYKKVLSSLNF